VAVAALGESADDDDFCSPPRQAAATTAANTRLRVHTRSRAIPRGIRRMTRADRTRIGITEGADLTITTNGGLTPLALARQRGKQAAVNLLELRVK
jgi:hypothetical protein